MRYWYYAPNALTKPDSQRDWPDHLLTTTRWIMEACEESYENQMKHSDIIFTAISTSDFKDFEEAQRVVVMMYVTDMSFSRAGISHALKRLEKHYKVTTPSNG